MRLSIKSRLYRGEGKETVKLMCKPNKKVKRIRKALKKWIPILRDLVGLATAVVVLLQALS